VLMFSSGIVKTQHLARKRTATPYQMITFYLQQLIIQHNRISIRSF